MQERVKVADGNVIVPGGQQQGQNVRYAGDDIRQGAVVFKRGQIVRPAELGMIASLGIGEVSVYRKLRVAFFSTGDELVPIGGTLGRARSTTATATRSTACSCGWASMSSTWA